MAEIGRRSAIALGLVAAAAPALGSSRPAAAATYGPDEGRELVPGVRQVDLSQREALIPGYGTVSMRDIVYQPGAKTSSPGMNNDMVCHVLEGQLAIDQGEDGAFVAEKGDVWTCAEGTPETTENRGDTVAIMRVTDLLRA